MHPDIANASAFPEQKRAPTSTSTSTSTPKRAEALIEALPKDRLFPDIGHKTIELFKKYINSAGSIFVNGPAGMYETEPWADGTRELWRAIADAPGYTVIGGGDTISAATKFTELSKYGYVCTGGGAWCVSWQANNCRSLRQWNEPSKEILANIIGLRISSSTS